MTSKKRPNYPTDTDYQKLVNEFIRMNAQEFLRDEYNFFVCTHKTNRLADIGRRPLYGYETTESLREGVYESDSSEKSTAFSIRSDEDKATFVSELNEMQETGEILDDESDLRVKEVDENEDSIDIGLEYTVSRRGTIDMLDHEEKTTNVELRETDREDIWEIVQNYERSHEFTANKRLFDAWSQTRHDQGKDQFRRLNLTLERLRRDERIDLFDDILDYNPEQWDFDDVEGIGIERDGDVEQVDEEILTGINDAALKGKGLRSNEFVQRAEKNGYYFTSIKIAYIHSVDAKRALIRIAFKKKPKNTCDISIEKEQEIVDDNYEPTSFDEEVLEKTRDEFRDMVVRLYADYLPDEMELEVEAE